MSVRLSGDRELVARFSKLGSEADGVTHRAAKDWADAVTDSAQRRAPVDTGKLRKRIKPTVRGNNAQVTSDAVNPDTGRSYAAYVELGTGHGPAQPYLYPAFAEHRDVALYVRRALSEVVDL